MRIHLVVAFVAAAALAACNKPVTVAQYTAQWAGVMEEFERTTGALPEPVIEEGWSVEKKREAVADALVAAGKEIERVSKMQDALKPPAEAAKLHQLTSAFFHEEVEIFRAYSDATRKGESTDPVRERFRVHAESRNAIYDEAAKIGFDALAPAP